MISPTSGIALTPLAIALASTAEVLARRRRAIDAGIVIAAATALGFAALLLMLPEAAHRPARVLAVQTLVVSACLGFNVRWRRPAVTTSAAILPFSIVLLALAPFWETVTPSWLLSLSVLGQTSVALILAVAVRMIVRREWNHSPLEAVFVDPLCLAALATSILGATLLARLGTWATLAPLAGCVGWLGVLWPSGPSCARMLLTAAQVAGSIAVVLAVTALLRVQGWVADDVLALFTPHSLHAQGVGLTAFALLAVLARMMLRSSALPAASGTVHGALRTGLVVGQLALATWGLAPAVRHELMDGVGVVEQGVFTVGAWWLLLAMVALVAGEWLRDRGPGPSPQRVRAGGSAAAGCRRGGEGSVVAALCWGLAVFFLSGSVLNCATSIGVVATCTASGGRQGERYGPSMLAWCGSSFRRWCLPAPAPPAASAPAAVFFDGPGVIVALVLPVAAIGAGCWAMHSATACRAISSPPPRSPCFASRVATLCRNRRRAAWMG